VRLAELLAAHAPYDGSFPLRVPGVHAIRRSTVSRDMVRATVSPALCVVAQGAKVVVLGREVYAYDASRMIAYSVELPVAAQIVRATRREPFLALKLDLHGGGAAAGEDRRRRCGARASRLGHVAQAVDHGRHDRLQHAVVRLGQLVVDPQASLAIAHESHLPQVGQVARGLRLRDAERLVDVADADLAARQQREDAEARLVGEGLEDLLHRGQMRAVPGRTVSLAIYLC
jgi:hypothetical protein